MNSQNYNSGAFTAYNDQADDDFIVPSGSVWRVKEVDVTGCCSGPPTSEVVSFYRNRNGKPGRLLKSFTVVGTGNPSFQLPLGRGIRLGGGHHYWLSVVANCNYNGGCGDWGWGITSTITNDPAVWEQPGNGAGTGCTTFTPLETCFGDSYNGDLMFEFQGRSR